MKRLLRIVLALAAVYAVLFVALAVVMRQPPQRFGSIIKHLPMPIVWGILPGPAIWEWARQGSLAEGQLAPDFTLATHDGAARVALSSFRGQRPVVLVFGSYT